MSTPVSRPHRAAPLGLVAAYPLDTRAGRVAADASGRGNDGVIDGARWTPDGRFGEALRFDGAGDMVRIPASRSLDLTGAMTLSAWIRPSRSQSGWRTVLHRQTDAYFLDAGGGQVDVNTLGAPDDAQAALGALRSPGCAWRWPSALPAAERPSGSGQSCWRAGRWPPRRLQLRAQAHSRMVSTEAPGRSGSVCSFSRSGCSRSAILVRP